MATISELKQFIRNYVKENHQEQITGTLMQGVLIKMVDDLPEISTEDCVKFIEQELTEAQKAQARENIGAASTTSDAYTKSETDALLATKQGTIADLNAIRTGAGLGATALQSVPAGYATEGYVNTAVSGKQDAINDLAAIRSGAALGSTALQSVPSTYATKSYVDGGLTLKQDIINDLSDIRSGAALGATALQSVPSTYAEKSYVDNAVSGKQNTINDLATIRSGAALGATALQAVPDTYASKTYVDTAVGAKQDSLSTAQLAAVNSGIDSTKVGQIATNTQGIVDVNDRIDNLSMGGRYLAVWNCVTGKPGSDPTTMPYTYKSGDFFVVGQTGTTNYIPDDTVYSTTSAVTIYTGTINTNDFIRFDGTSWEVQNLPQKAVSFASITGSYSDNTSLNTAMNLKANTSDLNGYYTKGEADTLLAAKQGIISDLATIRSGAALGATALQSVPSGYATETYVTSAVSGKQDTISDLAAIRSGATLGSTALQSVPAGYATEDYVDTALTTKEDVISDLATIRSGAALGATALQSVPAGYATESFVGTAVSGKEDASNKVTSITSASTNAQYPSAALLYDRIQNYKIRMVSAMPASPDANTIYFVTQ